MVAAGKRVMEVASRHLTCVTLELGGKSAAIVLPDADLGTTVPGIASAAWMNNGQACVAQPRITLPRSRSDEFADAFAQTANVLRQHLQPRHAGPVRRLQELRPGREFGPEGYGEYLERKMIHLPAGWEG